MSLIHDALNKTDQYLERFVVSKPVPKPAAHPESDPDILRLEKEIKKIEAKRPNLKVLVPAFLAAVFMIWMSRVIVPPAEKSMPKAAPVLVAAVKEDAKPAVSAALPKPETVVVKSKASFFNRTESKVKFMLTGITSSDDQDLLAVINDQVVGVGDTLREGAVVTKIAADRVILDIDGQKIVLTF